MGLVCKIRTSRVFRVRNPQICPDKMKFDTAYYGPTAYVRSYTSAPTLHGIQ